jgi:hypothetical protein
MNRAIGIVVLAIGLLVLFGGLGWATKQYMDEEKNTDEGPGPFNNPDESSENAGSGLQGMWIAGAGLVVTVVGVVLLVMGRRSPASA